MSGCKRMKVQAIGICVSGNVLYSTNTPNGVCTGEKGKCGCTHAEVNLFDIARDSREKLQTVMLSHSPCMKCATEMLKQLHLTTVIYNTEYRDTEPLKWLRTCGIRVINAKGWLNFD